MVSLINRSIEVDWLKFLFRVFTIDVLERDAPAGEKVLDEKRALVTVPPGH